MRTFSILLVLFAASIAHADILDTYVREGLESNLALQQQTLTLEQSIQALKEAQGLFYPTIGIEARYSRAGGGRSIDIPIGDLINPMHTTLNSLLGQTVFSGALPNEQIPFLREKEHDTKLRVVQPLFQPGIYYNHKIQRERTHIQQAAKNAFARELVRDIKTAYYNHLKTVQLLALLTDTQTLLEENLRVSQKLVDADKATQDAVFRARAERAELQQHQAEARRDSAVTAAYFNFLRNRPQDAPIQHADVSAINTTIPKLNDMQQTAQTHRDEFQQLQTAVRAAQHAVSLSKSTYLPTINFVYDYGFEGETYTFDGAHDYWMASIIMNWNLFDGFQKSARISQRKLEQHKLETQQNELEAQIALQVRRAYYALLAAHEAVQATSERAESARQSFRIVRRKYEEGLTPQVAYLDARTAQTRAEIQHIIATYDIHIHLANLERAAATYTLP